MSGETRKGQQQKKTNKNEPKEQRKQRSRPPPANLPPEKIQEPQKAPEKPDSEEPGPEFYKNLKRETDEILKITEESSAKYSKKVIQSNWKKYEAPIESYEEREEVENMGADFEQLVNAPISSGGHFQFKHEKSWHTATKTSEYDKYFDINMTNLAIGLSTIPFYDRNDIDVNIFSQGDVSSMMHRVNKFKKQYQHNIDESAKENVNVDPTENMLNTFKDYLVMINKDEVTDEKKTENELQSKIDLKVNNNEKDTVNQPDSDVILKDNNIDHEIKVEMDNVKESNKDNFNTLDFDKVKIEPVHKSKDDSEEELKMLKGMEKRLDSLSAGAENLTVSDTEEDLEGWLDDFLSQEKSK